MKNLFFIRPVSFINQLSITFIMTLGFWFCAHQVIAQQKVIAAADIMKKIERAEAVELKGVTIVGDLDFTQLEKKFRGGSYGVRKGVVKEFFTKLLAPVYLKDCTLQGTIITFGTEKKPGILKENFVAFDELIVFENCHFTEKVTFERMTFYKGIEIRNCRFDQSISFDRVHFAKAPVVEGGNTVEKLRITKTNWEGVSSALSVEKGKEPATNTATVILHNNTAKNIQIRFGFTTWNLNPFGKSSLSTKFGTKIYLLEDGKKQRVLLTIAKEMEGQEFELSKL